MPDDAGETLLTKFAVDIAVRFMLIACPSNGRRGRGRGQVPSKWAAEKLTNCLASDLWGCGRH